MDTREFEKGKVEVCGILNLVKHCPEVAVLHQNWWVTFGFNFFKNALTLLLFDAQCLT